ncbi:MAG: hypothetical protein Q7V62_09250, partial [Actinomycetota bacterium]|nr:hypothetical protein [Actinomycetota bacterium]
GFVAAADQLDALVNAASALADAVAQLCSAWWAPDHFDTPLAPFDPAGHPRGWPSAMFTGPLDDSLTTSLQTIARDMRASIEDPVALHRRFPRLPIPGASLGVIAGRLPGTHAVGRLTWHFQNHHVSSMVRRGGAVFAARPGVADTAAGGHLVSDTDLYVAVRDGVAACWFREWTVGHFHSARLLEQALITLRGTGLADV